MLINAVQTVQGDNISWFAIAGESNQVQKRLEAGVLLLKLGNDVG
jgi:hypothetical protein